MAAVVVVNRNAVKSYRTDQEWSVFFVGNSARVTNENIGISLCWFKRKHQLNCVYLSLNIKIKFMSNEQTLGQKRVKAEFNPAKNGTVDQIKNLSAQMIDLIENMRSSDSTGEKHRVLSIAQTEIETACMYAVKSCFTE